MRMKFLCLLLALIMVLGLCACGGNAESTTVASTTGATTAATTEATTEPDDGKVTYTIKVTDEAGNPISGAMVQICLDNCYPGATGADGVAIFNVVEADYKVSFLSLPAGYTYADETMEFYFADGSYDMTIALKAA